VRPKDSWGHSLLQVCLAKVVVSNSPRAFVLLQELQTLAQSMIGYLAPHGRSALGPHDEGLGPSHASVLVPFCPFLCRHRPPLEVGPPVVWVCVSYPCGRGGDRDGRRIELGRLPEVGALSSESCMKERIVGLSFQ
jgi:hypothetical protein